MPRPSENYMAFQMYIFYGLFIVKFPFISDKTPKVFVYLWEFISWMCTFMPLHMTICILKTIYDQFDMETITTVGVEAVWFFFSFLVMVQLRLQKYDVPVLMTAIQDTFKWRSPRGKTYVTMDKAFRIGKYVSIFWQCCPTSFITVSLFFSVITRPSILPVPTWYPINRDDPCQFALAYFLQVWAKMVMVFSFVVGSSFFISFSLMCIAQFNILQCAMKNLIYTSGVYQRFPDTTNNSIDWTEHAGEYTLTHELLDTLPSEPRFSLKASDLNNSNLSPEEIKSFQNALKNCVQHHINIVKMCAMMEGFLNGYAFLRLGELTLQICFVAFMYAKNSGIGNLLIMAMTVFDVFLFTYPSEYIQFLSKDVGSSLMLGPWDLVSKHFQKDFIIIMAYSMRPIIFTAGRIFVLNIDRFRLVVTTAFSYYTVLTNFDSL